MEELDDEIPEIPTTVTATDLILAIEDAIEEGDISTWDSGDGDTRALHIEIDIDGFHIHTRIPISDLTVTTHDFHRGGEVVRESESVTVVG